MFTVIDLRGEVFKYDDYGASQHLDTSTTFKALKHAGEFVSGHLSQHTYSVRMKQPETELRVFVCYNPIKGF